MRGVTKINSRRAALDPDKRVYSSGVSWRGDIENIEGGMYIDRM